MISSLPLSSPARAVPLAPEGAILCDADFSPAPDAALELAAEWARCCGAPLRVAHTVDLPGALLGQARAVRWVVASRKRALRQVAAALRARGVRVTESVRFGRLEEELRQIATEEAARLIVLHPARSRRRWGGLAGSAAWRLVECAHTATLVPRDPTVLRAWLRGGRTLRVFVGFNFTPASEAALRWVKQLAALGPIDVILGCVNAPGVPSAHAGGVPFGFGIGAPPAGASQGRELSARARMWLDLPARCRIESKRGRTASQLLAMATQEHADLIVIGAPVPRELRRWWRPSVARAVLEGAGINTVLVPLAPDLG
jgi:nucleotide-binding universal stress UspA family protein